VNPCKQTDPLGRSIPAVTKPQIQGISTMKNPNIFVTCLILLSFTGCSTNSTPTCGDENVKKLVLESTYEVVFKQLLPEQIQINLAELIEETRDSATYNEYEKIDPQGEGFAYGTMPVKYFLKFTETSKTAATIKENIAKQIKEMNISLDAIRTSNRNTDLKKVSCESNLASANGNTIPIQYTAQLTEDKKILVKVTGL
jgi:hypothetical protein